MKNICILLFLMLQDVAYSQKNERGSNIFLAPRNMISTFDGSFEN